MDNYKIKVKDEAESKEAQELFFELGFRWEWTEEKEVLRSPIPYLFTKGKNIRSGFDLTEFDKCVGSEITLPQLRDLVVLKRNDARDANVYEDAECSCLYDLYLTSDRELYFYHCGKEKWITSNLNHDEDYYAILKPIEKLQPKDPDLISGAEALRALADGKDVQVSTEFTSSSWHNDTATYSAEEILAEEVAETDDYGSMKLFFRLKPTTLKVSAELPKPSNVTLHNQNYSITYEFKTREERNAFADKLRGTNS